MKAEHIRDFLRSPATLSKPEPTDVELWKTGMDLVKLCIKEKGGHPLRPRQEQAILGFAENRCSLLLGPPGTGKTSVVAWMVVGYAAACRDAGRPCRVLVNAFTRNAIHTLLEAIAARRNLMGEDFRVAFVSRTAADEVGAHGTEACSWADLPKSLEQEIVIVGMTSWSILSLLKQGHLGTEPGFEAEAFDATCIDEASQLRVGQGLVALAALRDGGRVLVAGDDRQLGPIGKVEEWAGDERSVSGSLYGLLQAAQVPEFALNETFRLNAPLVQPPSALFYENDYVSAKPVAQRRLSLRPGWKGGLPDWLVAALDPDHPICILLHDGPPAAARNPLEAQIVKEVVTELAERLRDADGAPYGEALWQDGLAVVSPHRAQNALIRRLLDAHGLETNCVVETVERIQGRERDAIVMSYTVADPEYALAEAAFLFAPERFNVAITRPRSKLIMVVSRRLLEVLPPEEELVDAAQYLREYVFGSRYAGVFQQDGHDVEVRLRRFDDDAPLPEISTQISTLEPLPEFTDVLKELDRAIRELSEQSKYSSATSFEVDKRLARTVAFGEYRALLRLGRLAIVWRSSKTAGFWSLHPMHDDIEPWPCTPEAVSANLEGAVSACRGSYAPCYLATGKRRGVRDYFVWCDMSGEDLLWPLLQKMADAQRVTLGTDPWSRTTVEVPHAQENAPIVAPPHPELSDSEFRLLNLLEDLELRRIDLGIVESWLTVRKLRDACTDHELLSDHYRTLRSVNEAVERLRLHGYLMRASDEDDRIRSRMAELARELRYVKQRFTNNDAHKRPFLVRSLKVLAEERRKPIQDQPLRQVIADVEKKFDASPATKRVLSAIVPAMERGFRLTIGAQALLSGFQRRSLENLVPAWLQPEQPFAAVITADTGAGKTEAACIPLLIGSAVDRMRGVRGVRAVLVYPRIRLAINQAERLVRYANELNRELGDLVVTVGLQTGDVPSTWEWANPDLFVPIEGRQAYRFPFFRCQAEGCDAPLTVEPGRSNAPADTLRCEACGWEFAGWVGTKEGIRRNPPALFIPVTESLHQWLMQPQYGHLFGDADFSPPRALLADEVHLYGHIHGAQVGWTLQRLLGRCRINGEKYPLAIGMSATLGDPRQVWGELCGHPSDRVVLVTPEPDERKENPRGREYYYFVQPEVESRGKDIAGTSTSIQSLMLLAHGMRRRTGANGGFRSIAFLDSIDKLKRIHGDYLDAETNKRLAALRTSDYGPDPQDVSQFRNECCGEPDTCSRFRDGECWHFAATDQEQVRAGPHRQPPGRPLTVMAKPVFSGTSGNVDRAIAESDVLFATSSLEVGFDDPNMALVYQHYAPSNLASFVQRKGRGGRGADDRPLTAVTLSVYSPRDSYLFARPRRMLEAADFRVPINMHNSFVVRGQVLAAMLDATARHAAQTGESPQPQLPAPVLKGAEDLVHETFGAVEEELGGNSLREHWDAATNGGNLTENDPNRWREQIESVPSRLFDSINVPLLTVVPEGSEQNPRSEDVGLALAETAPGKVTRRWGLAEAHWTPPTFGTAAWFTSEQIESKMTALAPGHQGEALKPHVPEEVWHVANGKIAPKAVRPTEIRPRVAGRFAGASWKSCWAYHTVDRVVREKKAENDVLLSKEVHVNHKTNAHLRGFVVVATTSHGERIEVPALRGFGNGALTQFRQGAASQNSGLHVVQAYWGSDIELVMDNPKRDRSYHRQVFCDPTRPDHMRLFGYDMQPEGIQLELESARIDEFLELELKAMNEVRPRDKWHRGQFLRYLVMTNGSRAGLNRYEGKQLADLCITAAACPVKKADLARALGRSKSHLLAEALKYAADNYLGQHPQLPTGRVDKLLTRLEDSSVMRALKDAWDAVRDGAKFRGYLRSVLLHGLLVRLRELFVIHGLTDERRVVSHARLPVQYPTHPSDVLTVCERGSGGDGTTRSFVSSAADRLDEWVNDSFVSCPNARADQLLEQAFSLKNRHADWGSQDPRREDWVRQLANELGADPDLDGGGLQVVLRMLYGREEVEGHVFEMRELYSEVHATRLRLAADMEREPTVWEVVGTVVAGARASSPDALSWGRLRAAYVGVQEVFDHPDEEVGESLSPDHRIADQIHRISARLCVDGCQACVHTPSDVMDAELAEACTSRQLLERFAKFLKSNDVTSAL